MVLRQYRTLGSYGWRLTLLISTVVAALLVAAATSAVAIADSPLAPAVTGISPPYGPPTGGTSVTITGTSLAGATEVKFGSTDAGSFEVNSETEITAVSPAGGGVTDVRVTTLGGTSATAPADEFSYAPVVTRVEPNDGAEAGGTPVTISGANFTGATAVKFGLHDAESFNVSSDGSITAVSPFLNGQGVVDVTVIGPGGTSATGPQDRFGYGPVIEQIAPSQGPGIGGTPVTITGFGLEGATELSFGSTPVTSFTANPDGSITALTPPFAGGSAAVPVTVTTPAGSSIASPRDPGILPVNYFRYGPTVTKVEPDHGSAAGGTLVTIHGTGFSALQRSDEQSFLRAVQFGASVLSCGSDRAPLEISCTPVEFEVKSETEITAISPPGTGTVDVSVETFGGTNPSSPADQFAYDPLAREPNSNGPEAEILSSKAVVSGHPWTRLVLSCVGEPGGACSGSIGLSGIPHSIGSGKVRRYSSFRQFSLPAGSKRPIAIHLLPYVVPLLEEVHRLRVRAVINFARAENVEKPVVLRSRPAI